MTCAAVELTLRPGVAACRLLLLVGSLLEDEDDLFESPESERVATGAARREAVVVVERLVRPVDFLLAEADRDGFPGLMDVVLSGGVGGRSPLSFLTAFLSLLGVSGTVVIVFPASSDVGVLADRPSSSSADLHSKLARSLF